MSAEQVSGEGNADVECNLGIYYLNLQKEDAKAFACFKKAVALGSLQAKSLLGFCYYHGKGIVKNSEQAFACFREAAEMGEVDANYYLGICYFFGEGTNQDYKKALEFLQRAADLGNIEANYHLGICYFFGEGIDQNYEKAFRSFQRAIDLSKTGTGYLGNSDADDYLGDADINYYLGACHFWGKGTVQNYEKAFDLFRRAAWAGNIDAQRDFAMCNENGIGTEKNLKRAVSWYEKAAKQGDEEASSCLTKLLQTYPQLKKPEEKLGKPPIEIAQSSEITTQASSATPSIQKPETRGSKKRKSKEAADVHGKKPKLVNDGTDLSLAVPSLVGKALAVPSNDEHLLAEQSSSSSTDLISETDKPSAAAPEAVLPKSPPLIGKPRTKKKPEKSAAAGRQVKSPKSSNEADIIPQKRGTTQLGKPRKITVTEKEFVPALQPEKLDYANVRFFKADAKQKPSQRLNKKPIVRSSFTSSKPPEKKTQLTEPARIQIGRWGESAVYLKLQQHYKEKYGGTFLETETGFVLNGQDKDRNAVELEVRWHNKKEESGDDRDFSIVKKKNGAIKERYIEVKTTTSGETHTATFPLSEWQAMLTHKDKYAIYRVFNAGQADRVRIEKFKNPLQKIMDGELGVASIQLKI